MPPTRQGEALLVIAAQWIRPPMRAPSPRELLAHALAIGLARATLPHEPDGQEFHFESGIEPHDLARGHRNDVAHVVGFAANPNGHIIHAQHARA